MAKIVKKPVVPIYLVAALWVVWAIFFPLYRPLHFILAAIASVALYCIGRAIWPDKTYEAPDPEPKETKGPGPQKAERTEAAQPENTGNPEMDALIAERARAAGEMRRLNDSIKDEKISAQISRLETTTGKIIDAVVEKPSKLPQIRKFMNYYLPTTLKLLNAYDRMDATGVSGANIDGTKGRIEDMLDTICTAFSRQLDDLYGEEAMDVSAEIKVMEQMLAQEGLGGMTMGGV